jgi:hypothetical protein
MPPAFQRAVGAFMSEPVRPSNRVLVIVAGVAIAINVVTALPNMSSDLSAIELIWGIFLFGVLLALPHLILLVNGIWLKLRWTRLLSLAGMAAALFLWLLAWYATYIDNPAPDAQDALVYVIVPVYAGAAAIALAIVLRLADWLMTRTSRAN